MIKKFLKLSLFLTSFLFLTGFVPLPAVLGPAITVATSGNLVKATAQLVFDNELKRFTEIDIYNEPFDKEAGFSIIKLGKFEIFIFKLEKLHNSLRDNKYFILLKNKRKIYA